VQVYSAGEDRLKAVAHLSFKTQQKCDPLRAFLYLWGLIRKIPLVRKEAKLLKASQMDIPAHIFVPLCIQTSLLSIKNPKTFLQISLFI
jgi:hypothetical protein